MGHHPLPRLRTTRRLRPLRSPLHPRPQPPHRHLLARRNDGARLHRSPVSRNEPLQLQLLHLHPPNPQLRHRPLRHRSPARPRRRWGPRAEPQRHAGLHHRDLPETEVFDYGLYGVDGRR